MRKILAITLVFSLLFSLLIGSISAFAAVPTADDLNGYENICLAYTFKTSMWNNGRLSKNNLMPYVGYLDQQGNIKDFFFDSFLFLPCMAYGPSGARMHLDESNPTKAIDWTTYIDDTFRNDYNVDALNRAFGEVKSSLNQSEKKAGVFFTILYPGERATNFGSLGGKQLNFSKMEDRKYAVKWMIDEQISRFEDKEYENLEMVGFYWLEEYLVNNNDFELIKYAADYLHGLGLKFIWIPWYCANGYNRVNDLGFDVACMQPNLFWQAYTDPNRVKDSIAYSTRYGMGMEIELDFNVFEDYYFNRYLYYLEGGMNSAMMNSVKMYYQDASPGVYYTACYSNDKRYRDVYELTYKYAKGTLTQSDIDAVKPEGVDDNFVEDINMKYIVNCGVDWISIGNTYTGCESYVDGNGAAYQNVSGKELTDGKIAMYELSTDWHAFHDDIRDSEGRMSVTIDLGEIRTDITNFAAHFDNRQLYSIGSPADIEISVSNNGRSFTTIARPELTLDPNESCFWHTCDPVTARYVKLSFDKRDKLFVFCSEFLVGTGEPKPPSTEDEIVDDGSNENNGSSGDTGNSGSGNEDNNGEEATYMLGDVNGNSRIDARDYLLLKRGFFKTYNLDSDQRIRGDINKNNKIDARDYLLLKRMFFKTYTPS